VMWVMMGGTCLHGCSSRKSKKRRKEGEKRRNEPSASLASFSQTAAAAASHRRDTWLPVYRNGGTFFLREDSVWNCSEMAVAAGNRHHIGHHGHNHNHDHHGMRRRGHHEKDSKIERNRCSRGCGLHKKK